MAKDNTFGDLYNIEYAGVNVNQAWKDNIQRWKFYSDSYNGGNNYRDGQYLVKYTLESPSEFSERLSNTALDNHCKAIIDTYNSFLFRLPPKRDYGSLEDDPQVDAFHNDADLDGQTFNSFMKQVSQVAAIYGHAWVMVDKPTTIVNTRAEELQQEIRPYVSLFSPENILDWSYKRNINGKYQLQYIKILESFTSRAVYYKEYFQDRIETWKENLNIRTNTNTNKKRELIESIPNKLDIIPIICVYSHRSNKRAVGLSDISDISDIQRSIYNELSELEQIIRISNHPSLVKTADVEASAGAGSIITIPNELDASLKPYLIQPSGANIDSLLNSINEKVESINRIAHLGGKRATKLTSMSGIAMETEFQLLNAKLSEKADNLELAEEMIWRLFALWQNKVWDGVIDYPNNFNVNDKFKTLQMLELASKIKPSNAALLKHMDIMIANVLVDDEDILKDIVKDQPDIIVDQKNNDDINK